MTKQHKALLLKLLAVIISTLPVAIVTLSYFPLWKNRGAGAVLSGFTVFLLLICFSPLLRLIKKHLSAPSSFTAWLLMFIAFSIIESIVYEMIVISFVGMTSNLLSSALFKAAKGRDIK